VTSNPSAAYIERVSKVFEDNGKGVTGDMQAVITAILTDTEARAGDSATASVNVNYGHLREPVLFMPNMLRGLNVTLGSQSAIYYYTNLMGQNLFNAPSVFSYFSPQYRTAKGLLGPEFQIYSTQTVVNRADAVDSALYGTLDKSTTVNLTPFMQYASNTNALLDNISYVFLYHSMSSDLQQTAAKAVNAASTPQRRVQAALYLVLTSGEYQIIH
jgi:uncharacterized protein (DUF1800 family)